MKTNSMKRLAVLDDWPGVARQSADWTELAKRVEIVFFDEPFSDEQQAAAELASFDIIFAMRDRTPFPSSLVQRLPKLELFVVTGRRSGVIDFNTLKDQGVLVCWTEGGESGVATAELALALMLAAARRLPSADAGMRAGRFQEGYGSGIELAGRTLGLIGLGRTGSLMAGYGRALGMNVIAWSYNLTTEAASERGATAVSKQHLMSCADVVSLHVVLSERTRNILGAAELNLMKPGAILVNTSRGALIDEVALSEAVATKRIFAALDVYHQEPLPKLHALRQAPNTVLTPHIGYGVAEIYQVFFQQGIENILAHLDGKAIRTFQ